MLESEAIIAAIKEAVKEIALLLGGANIILVALITWLGKIWMDRILESERRKTQVLIEQLKSSLTQEREKLNQVLKTQLDQSRFFFEKTISFLSDNQRAISDKRLSAFEKLWEAISDLRKLAPVYLDVLSPDEYEFFKTKSKLISLRDGINAEELIERADNISSELKLIRIYIPMIIWQLYDSYRIISLGPQLKLKLIFDPSSSSPVIPWYRDPSLRNIIEKLLDDEEIKEFDRLQMSQVTWILDRIEIKLLGLLQGYISGDIALKEMSEQSALLDEANRKVEIMLSK